MTELKRPRAQVYEVPVEELVNQPDLDHDVEQVHYLHRHQPGGPSSAYPQSRRRRYEN